VKKPSPAENYTTGGELDAYKKAAQVAYDYAKEKALNESSSDNFPMEDKDEDSTFFRSNNKDG
jgi:hypothetical protein|tara:strand:- start:388 stop:576 length:189 start_codon:yes stop_codon:yes gene_type:complete